MVPVIETARLLLRQFRADDAAAHAALLGDSEVMRYVGGRPIEREDAWRRLLAGRGLWPLLGYGYWAVERREDGRFLGQIGFADFHRFIIPDIGGLPEMGWMFAREAQGQGIALEAGMAALEWIDGAMPDAEVVAIISPGNAASIRLAERLGFSQTERTEYKGDATVIFRRRR